MGKLIYSLNVSLDGYAATSDGGLDWANVDEELHTWFNDRAKESAASIYGRRMYELMAGYWPTAETDPAATPAMLEFAAIWRDLPKIVFSSTLDHVEWNSRLVRGDAVEEVAKLKSQPDFLMDVGGPTLASTLMRHGLIDEYRVYVHPMILGAGTPFFPPMEERVGLHLLGTRTFGSGVVQLRYEVAS